MYVLSVRALASYVQIGKIITISMVVSIIHCGQNYVSLSSTCIIHFLSITYSCLSIKSCVAFWNVSWTWITGFNTYMNEEMAHFTHVNNGKNDKSCFLYLTNGTGPAGNVTFWSCRVAAAAHATICYKVTKRNCSRKCCPIQLADHEKLVTFPMKGVFRTCCGIYDLSKFVLK